ncbi:MAG: class I SAM-dependent methyltransferase [Planctomycetaceae bacterium]|nr:class I SAM-dependent methyltransferase [Planctomycetaceae bacterium]
MSEDVFSDVTDVYEAMIDWQKRLANEGRFYRSLFDRVGVRSVADVACGTGRHAEMFHSWGLRVQGADISVNMIERARTNFGESNNLRWAVRSFDQPIQPSAPFDAVICTGNSLALASDMPTVERAVREMLAAVRGGGVVVLHVLNLWRLPDGPCVWQKCKRATLERGDVLIAKGVHRTGSSGYVDLIIASLDTSTTMQTESVPILGIEAEKLDQTLRNAGASSVRIFGNYQEQPYNRDSSVDLIAVAEK